MQEPGIKWKMEQKWGKKWEKFDLELVSTAKWQMYMLFENANETGPCQSVPYFLLYLRNSYFTSQVDLWKTEVLKSVDMELLTE